jgi:uncharacterized membrane protein YdjX (TVP38/TMEM64 family)
MLFVYLSGAYHDLSFQALKQHHKIFAEFVRNYFFLVSFLYIVIYVAATALSFPGTIILTFLGGYLFPQPLSTLYVIFSATCGAVIVFVVSKTAFGDSLKNKTHSFFKKLDQGFKENGACYLLFLRFVPIVPFWMLNIAAAFFYHISIKTFIWTTIIGVTPGAIIFTLVGGSFKKIFETDQTFSLATVFNIEMKLAIALLGLFALAPILLKKFMKSRKNRHSK